MKKLLVLTAALALFAAPAFATIVGGKHDLSGKGVGNGTNATTEICVFCHTPHSAGTTTADAIPLANRTTTTGSIFCLSCHDGSVAYNDITNPSNADGAGGATYNFGGPANMGAYASNNHPVDVLFTEGVNGMVPTAPSIITNLTNVTCSSCHDVHEPAYAPFLKMNNNGSNLCRACHNK